ncbi:glycosyltransferase family 4 protein [Fluviicola sp. SGL-29]|nr:glycosyltransferase family 4 protein [Fluviicola sp. SGL-29]
MKTVLYISYDGMTDPLGQSQVLPYLHGLCKNGYRISLISCEKKERFEQHREQIERFCNEAGINWHPLSYTKKPPLLSTIWDLKKINRKAEQLYKTERFQLTHCRSYIAALAGIRMKKRYGTKMLFDMRGFWANERVDGNIWNLSNPLFKQVYAFFKRKERIFLSQSDHIISLTENGKNELLSWNVPAVHDSKITVIPCCVDLNLFDPETISPDEQNNKRASLGIGKTDYIVGYVGSIGTWYMLPEMLDYFAVFKKHHPAARFLFVTGEHPATILAVAHEKGIDSSAILVTSCLHKEVPLHISLFNESVFFIRPSYSKKASSPTKQGEIMAMGIPLVCNAGVGDTDRIVRQYHSGTVIETLNDVSYEQAVGKGISYDRNKTLTGATEYFSLESGVARYAKIYETLIG